MHVDGLVQNCSNSIANALELLRSCAKPSISILGQYLKTCRQKNPDCSCELPRLLERSHINFFINRKYITIFSVVISLIGSLQLFSVQFVQYKFRKFYKKVFVCEFPSEKLEWHYLKAWCLIYVHDPMVIGPEAQQPYYQSNSPVLTWGGWRDFAVNSFH